MKDLQEKIKEAKKDGYTDDDIVQFLAQLPEVGSEISAALENQYQPSEIVKFLGQSAMSEPAAPAAESESAISRGLGLATRAMAPTLAGAQIGSFGGPMGAVIGSMAVPAADAANALVNLLASPFTDRRLMPASQAIQNLMTSAGVPAPPETQTPTERVVSSGLEASTGVARTIPALISASTTAASPVTRGVAGQLAVAPGTQAVVTPTAVMTGQTVTEATGNPLYGAAATLGTGFAGSVKRPQKEQALSSDALNRIATDRYDQLQASGVQLKTDEFVDSMNSIAKGLRQEGYTPTGYPKITGAIQELTSTAQPKDWTEIQALRKMIRSGQTSMDPEERRLASILLDEYDNYLMTVPKNAIASGDMKNAGELWSQARNSYSRMKKSEVFEDMLNEAKLDRSKFTQSGEENSLAKQLRQLAKNDKRMRLFTKEEQAAIEQAAKGGTAQNLLKFFGRFAPTGPVSGMFTGGATVMNPAVGLTMAGTAAASRVGATNMRRASVNELSNLMRMGSAPRTTGGPFRATAPTTMRGLLSMENLEQQQRNLLGIQ
jgi:hypothetical protein